jgi:acetyl esterase/lipase
MNKKLAPPLIALLMASLACGIVNGPAPQANAASTSVPNYSTVSAYASVTPLPTPLGYSAPAVTQPAPKVRAPQVDLSSHTSKIQKDITYCTVDGVDLKLDLYFPKSLSGATPIVVFVHGGGWSAGDKSSGSGGTDFPSLLDAGFIVGSVNYRLAPQYKFPAMIEDVKCAIRFLRSSASTYNINPDKIGVWGGSAGGHLVSLLGTSDKSAGWDVGQYLDQSSRVQAVVDMFGPADLTTSFSGAYQKIAQNVFGTTSFSDPIFKAASPVTYITPDDPPFLILQGDSDKTVPLSQSQEFNDKLAAGGVSTKLIIVKGGPHGLNSPGEVPSRTQLSQMIVDFFTLHLK